MAGIDVMPDDGVNTATVNSKMTAIANAIREKTGESGTLTLDAMAAAIEALETGGGGAITYGSIIPSENTSANNYEVAHGLGEVPAVFFLWTTSEAKTQYEIRCDIFCKNPAEDTYQTFNYYQYSSTAVRWGVSSAVKISARADETKIKLYVFDAQYDDLVAGNIYRWVAVGGVEFL